jgi:O-antigen/teichoic acid export membrane protein
VSVKANAIANIVGSLVTALAIVVATPFYLRYLGGEAFGLVGIFTTLLGIASILDMGLTPALARELAKLSAIDDNHQDIASTVRTIEALYFCSAIGGAVIFYYSFPLLAIYWLPKTQLATYTVQTCLQWMGLQLALQLPIAFYTGGLMGLQRQTRMNIVNACFAAARALLTVILLYFGQLNIVGFFQLNTAITAVHLFVIAVTLWQALPKGGGTFKLQILVHIWPFALGMFGVTALSALLTQLDKIVLSRVLTLEHFGYYVLAWNISMLVIKPAMPIFNAFLPKMTQLAAINQEQDLALAYHQASKLINILVVPVALILAVLAFPLLVWYTGNNQIASLTSTALTLLVLGSACNALMLMPYALTLSYGWAGFALVQNALACIIIMPLTWWSSTLWGLTGGALGWFLVNVGYLVISVPSVHKRYLCNELKSWYLEDNLMNYRNYKTLWGLRNASNTK